MSADCRQSVKRLVRLNRAARHAVERGRYDLAVQCSDSAAAFLSSASPELQDCRLAVVTWTERGLVLDLDDRFEEALRARKRALELAREIVDFPESKLAFILLNIVQSLRSLDRNDEVAPYLDEARMLIGCSLIRARRPREASRARCLLLSIEADIQCDANEEVAAENLKAEALECCRILYPASLYPNGHPELANAITDYGWIAGERGDDVAMADRYREALAANELIYRGPEYPDGHPDLANAHNNMGYAHAQLGRLAEAEACYLKAMTLRAKLYPVERFPHGRAEMAVSHMNLGELLLRRGDLLRAQQQYRRALEIRRRLFPQEAFPNGHTSLLRSYLALGKVLVEREAIDEAVQLYRLAFAMACSLYPRSEEDDSNRAMSVWVRHDYGRALMLAGEYDHATRFFEEVCQLYETKPGSEDYFFASTLAALAELCARKHSLIDCEGYAIRAREMYEKVYPKSEYKAGHFNLANGLARLARIALLVNDFARARDHILESQRIYDAIAERFFFDSSMMEGLLLRAELARLPALLMSIGGWSDLNELFRAIFLTKGAVRRSQALKARALRAADREFVASDAETLARIRSELARILYAPQLPRYAQHRREVFGELVAQKEVVEQRLARVISPGPHGSSGSAQLLSDFLSRLPVAAVFLEVVRFSRTTTAFQAGAATLVEQDEYSIFVLDRTGVIARVDLGHAGEVDALTAAWRDAIGAGDDTNEVRTVSSRIWERLQPVMPVHTSTILLSPDGELHRLPWLALEDKSGRCLIEMYDVALATEPWLLSTAIQAPDAACEHLVVGNPQFGDFEETARKLAWENLEGTKREIEKVSGIIAGASVLDEKNAVSSKVLAGMSGKRIIHIATHGFFLDPAAAPQFDVDTELADPGHGGSPKEVRSARRYSQLLSGLVFAGANLNPTLDANGIPVEECPILTAEQIVGVDLSAAELVVLSACETILGETFPGEGVLGLRSAFHQAGAETVISSLWPVGDDQTAALMEVFYDNLLNRSVVIPQALRDAQLSILHNARLSGGRASPFDWAGFMVSIASWNSLERPPRVRAR